MLKNHETVTDRDRIKVLSAVFSRTEVGMGLSLGIDMPLRDRVERIVRAAQGRSLDPRLYRIAWFVRVKLQAMRREVASAAEVQS